MGDSYLLFAKPSFLEGLARCIDLGATLDEYNSSLTQHQADLIALRTDWETIGEDIAKAISQEEKKIVEQKQQIELNFDEK
jgi:hypothetical protein